MSYAIYKPSGEITAVLSCDPGELEINTPKGCEALDIGDGRVPGFSYVEMGEVVRAPEQPSLYHTFSYVTKQWEDRRTLAQVQAAQWATIKASRTATVDAPLETPYGTFDSNPAARTSITDAVLMLQTLEGMGTPTTIDFTLADNSEVELTTEQMVTVGLLLGQKTQEAHARARALRAEIDAASTVAEVFAIIW